MDKYLEINCIECGAISHVKQQVVNIQTDGEAMQYAHALPDLGHIVCKVCSAEWCSCTEHGRYECPPPCSICTHCQTN